MRRGSPQGYGGRRECGNGGATRAKGEMGSVWEVVSALASALTDARDQLVTLMHNSKGDATRMSGGCSRHATPARSYSPCPGAGTWVRNVHRGHAHGHIAFGCSSEYRLHPTPVRVRQPRPIFAEVSSSQPRRTPGRCTPPLHKMSPLRSPSPWPPHVGAGSRASQCDRLSRRDRACVNVSTRRNLGSPASCNRNASNRKNLSPDPRRHCIGTQYAALLREEAYQLRGRRMAEENRRRRRPPWGRC